MNSLELRGWGNGLVVRVPAEQVRGLQFKSQEDMKSQEWPCTPGTSAVEESDERSVPGPPDCQPSSRSGERPCLKAVRQSGSAGYPMSSSGTSMHTSTMYQVPTSDPQKTESSSSLRRKNVRVRSHNFISTWPLKIIYSIYFSLLTFKKFKNLVFLFAYTHTFCFETDFVSHSPGGPQTYCVAKLYTLGPCDWKVCSVVKSTSQHSHDGSQSPITPCQDSQYPFLASVAQDRHVVHRHTLGKTYLKTKGLVFLSSFKVLRLEVYATTSRV